MTSEAVGGSPLQVPTSGAEIFERGYRSYEGERTGIAGSMRTVLVASMQRALGLRRKFRFKIVPIIAVLLAYVPALIFLGVAWFFGSEFFEEFGLQADYAGYYGQIGFAIAIFAAFATPELLCSDRRTGMLGLYLAGPMTRPRYLLAKGAAIVLLMMLVTLVPLLFMLAGYSAMGLGPDGAGAIIKLLARIGASGLLVAIFITLVSMAVSTFTDRTGFAAAGVFMVMIGGGILTTVLVAEADANPVVQLIAPGNLLQDVVYRIFNFQPDTSQLGPGLERRDVLPVEDLSAIGSLGIFAAVCAVLIVIVVVSYRRLEVTK